jgi:hypothetical protein
LHDLRTCGSTTSTTTPHLPLSKVGSRPDRTDARARRGEPRPGHPRRARRGWTCGSWAWSTPRPFEAHDLLSGPPTVWNGPHNYVRLDPAVEPAHVLRLRRWSMVGDHVLTSDPLWYKRRSSTRSTRAASSTPTTTAPATSGGSSRSWTTWSGSAWTACGSSRSSTPRCATAATTSPPTQGPGRVRHVEDVGELLETAHERGIRVIIRHGDEPHVRPAPVVPGVPRTPRPARLVRLERHRRPLRRRPHHLRRHRGVELDLGPGPPAVLLAPVLLPPARPQLRQPRGAGGDVRRGAVLAGPRVRRLRLDAVPYLYEREGTNCENLPRPTSTSSCCARWWTTSSTTRSCSPRRTSGPTTSSPTSATGVTSATWRSTSPSCHACSWPPAARRPSRSSRS